jgi:hypothetical protein
MTDKDKKEVPKKKTKMEKLYPSHNKKAGDDSASKEVQAQGVAEGEPV